jgi:hypothetical protein
LNSLYEGRGAVPYADDCNAYFFACHVFKISLYLAFPSRDDVIVMKCLLCYFASAV